MEYETKNIPPYNLDAEKAVLGSILIDTDCVHEVRPFLKPQDFFAPENQWVYEACLRIMERGELINQITVAHQLSSDGKLDEVGGAAYLSHLISIVPTSLHAKYYGQIVKNSAILRRVISSGSQIAALGYSEADPKVAISHAENIMLRLQKEVALPQLIAPEDLAKLGAEYYSDLHEGKVPSIATGFGELDWITGGIYGGEYILIAARPSMGKTSLMLTMSQHIGNKYGNVLLVSLEERWRQILNKLISERTGYPLRLIRAGKYSDEQYGEIIYHLGGISEQRLYFVDSGDSVYNEGTTTPTIYSLATHMRSAHGLSAIFIDYLDLVDDAFGKNLYERTTYISKRLKQMAKSLDVPVFCLCQLSRQVEYRPLPTPEEMGEGRRPKMQDLRNSGALEQDADLILFLYRDDYYQEILKKACTKGLTDETWKWQICKTCDTPCGLVGKAELILAKQRQGGERDIRIPLHWNPHHFRYEGADKGQELE